MLIRWTVLLIILQGSLALAQPAHPVDGRALFTTHCAMCHGASGKGDGPAGAALDPAPRDLTRRPYKNGCGPGAIARTVREGIPQSGMPAYGEVLSEAQVRQLADYVRSLQGGCCQSKP